MNNFKDKVRTLTTKALEKKNRRYYGAVLVLVFMAMLLSMGMKDTAGASNPTAGVYGSFQNDEKKELNTLIKNYYKDYAKGDTEGIAKEASPLSEGEASYIKFFSQSIQTMSIKFWINFLEHLLSINSFI